MNFLAVTIGIFVVIAIIIVAIITAFILYLCKVFTIGAGLWLLLGLLFLGLCIIELILYWVIKTTKEDF